MAQTKQKTACLLLTASLAVANVINITEDNYNKLTAGKNIFFVVRLNVALLNENSLFSKPF